MSEKILSKVKPGVAVGKDLQEIFRIAKAEKFRKFDTLIRIFPKTAGRQERAS